jgi:spectrin beta
LEDKVSQVNLLADAVKSSYPNEQTNVNVRQKEVQDLWGKVMAKALERRSRLEDAVGHQTFMNNSRNLVSNIVITAASVDTALSSGQSLKLFKM